MRLRRLPYRLRLTLGFAAVMVVLFGGLALLLHTRFENSLNQGIDRSLRTHAADLATLVNGRQVLPELPESDGAFAQIIDPVTGRVLDATPRRARPALTRQQVVSAALDSQFIDEGERARLLAGPVDTRPAAVLVVGSSLAQRNSALTTLSDLLFIGGPILLLLTCLAGYGLAERALAPVQQMHVRLEDALMRERAFVADAGHELRTPLAILKLELELALTPGVSEDELRDRVRSSAEEVERLSKLAQDLLVIARAEQGELGIERRPVEVEQVLGAVADRLGPPALSRGRTVRLERSVVPAAGTRRLAVSADRAWLEQAMTNLVSNALRYGDGPVTLRATRRNGSVELHVLDEGRGFEPAFLPSAFERFARADIARSTGGSGLGLSIVRVIAEAHGGRAFAVNREHGGADVWLSLPAA